MSNVHGQYNQLKWMPRWLPTSWLDTVLSSQLDALRYDVVCTASDWGLIAFAVCLGLKGPLACTLVDC